MNMQYVLVGLGVLILFSGPIKAKAITFLGGLKNKILPTKDKTTVTPTVNNKFAQITAEWESFTKTLEENNMPSCAREMKKLLVKMATEYRSDLNVEPRKNLPANIEGVLVEEGE